MNGGQPSSLNGQSAKSKTELPPPAEVVILPNAILQLADKRDGGKLLVVIPTSLATHYHIPIGDDTAKELSRALAPAVPVYGPGDMP